MKRVAVIGLDGMSWLVLNKLFEYGIMPNLGLLINNSARGILKSTIPPVTPPAWTSIATGVNPGKHGIFDFLTLSRNYEVNIVSSYNVHYPRVHEMVALKGMKTICINQPITYPIIKIKNTHILSDWLAPKLSYYPTYFEKYVKTYKPYAPKHIATKKLSIMSKDCNGRVDAINNVMEKFDWNLFWVIYSEPDHILHRYYDQIMKGESPFITIFNKIDETIGLASKLADLVLVISDHGFYEYRYAININRFLDELGLIAKTWTKITRGLADLLPDRKKEMKTIRLPNKVHKMVLDKPFLKSAIKKIYRKLSGKELTASCPYVELKHSRAFMYSPSSFGIYVSNGNGASVDFILKKLEKLEGINQAWKREQLFHGPHVNKASHIIFMPNFNEGFTIAWSTRITPKIISVGRVYDHHPDGIILAWGNGVSPGSMGEIGAYDIVPTILNYLSLPLPPDTDGTSIPNIAPSPEHPKYYDYLKYWKLIKQAQVLKTKLAKQIIH